MKESIIKKIVVYAEMEDKKICLIHQKIPIKIFLSVIASFSKNNKIELLPLKDFELAKLSSKEIDNEYVDKKNKGEKN